MRLGQESEAWDALEVGHVRERWRCVSVIFPNLRRGNDGETEGVCDAQLV
jgi:hypothetical protein